MSTLLPSSLSLVSFCFLSWRALSILVYRDSISFFDMGVSTIFVFFHAQYVLQPMCKRGAAPPKCAERFLNVSSVTTTNSAAFLNSTVEKEPF